MPNTPRKAPQAPLTPTRVSRRLRGDTPEIGAVNFNISPRKAVSHRQLDFTESSPVKKEDKPLSDADTQEMSSQEMKSQSASQGKPAEQSASPESPSAQNASPRTRKQQSVSPQKVKSPSASPQKPIGPSVSPEKSRSPSASPEKSKSPHAPPPSPQKPKEQSSSAPPKTTSKKKNKSANDGDKSHAVLLKQAVVSRDAERFFVVLRTITGNSVSKQATAKDLDADSVLLALRYIDEILRDEELRERPSYLRDFHNTLNFLDALLRIHAGYLSTLANLDEQIGGLIEYAQARTANINKLNQLEGRLAFVFEQMKQRSQPALFANQEPATYNKDIYNGVNKAIHELREQEAAEAGEHMDTS